MEGKVLIALVKGISRRAIVVRAPDPRLFEQAIFLLREDALSQEGVSADQVLAEARQVAAGYIRRNSGLGRRLSRLMPLGYAALGGGLVGAVWAVAALL